MTTPQPPEAEALDLNAIRARANAATPGPWLSTWEHDDANGEFDKDEQTVIKREGSAPGAHILDDSDDVVVGFTWYDGPNIGCNRANALFIAHARTDVVALCDALATLTTRALAAEARVRGLEEVVENARELLHEFATLECEHQEHLGNVSKDYASLASISGIASRIPNTLRSPERET